MALCKSLPEALPLKQPQRDAKLLVGGFVFAGTLVKLS